MKTTTLPTIEEVVLRLARQCAAHGDWIPSGLWARYHRACRAARVDLEEFYFAAVAERNAAEAVAR
jgi:hypothetical protein